MAGLPSAFSPLRDILDGKHENNTFVNVVGFVSDFMPPVATRGKGSIPESQWPYHANVI